MTLGYDTYGFHNAADNPINGLFIADASAQAIGSIGLTGELDLGLLQAGATGSVGLSFGVTGINTTGPNSHSVETVDQNNKPLSETVLQLDDFTNDTVSGGPFCPFTVGGSASLSLSAFVQIGVSPFDINYSYPLGNITLFDFSCPSCQPPATPQLGELFGNLDPSTRRSRACPWRTSRSNCPVPPRSSCSTWATSRRAGRMSTAPEPADEDFEISLPTSQKGINEKALQISAFGAVEEIPGADTPGTTIVALEDSGTTPETVTVDQGVAASAYLIGGPYGNDFQYLGNGNTYMKGGTWDSSQGDPAQLKKPIQTLNTLQGGFGQNTLIGGNLSSQGLRRREAGAWNMLIANPAEVLGAGQDGGQNDVLQAGNAGATMKGGGFGGDNFMAATIHSPKSDPNSVDPSQPSQYVMIAGKNDKGLGADTMNGRLWPDRLRMAGRSRAAHCQRCGAACRLPAASSTSWATRPARPGRSARSTPTSRGVQVLGRTRIRSSIGQIDAYNITTLSVDADDQNNTGGETYVVNDLGTTDVKQVNVNLHEYTTAPDSNGDHVTINGSAGADTVNVGVQQLPTGKYDSNGVPIYHAAMDHDADHHDDQRQAGPRAERSPTGLTPPCPSRPTRSMSTPSPATTR